LPDTPHNSVKPGKTGFKMVPVTRNAPRSFITNIRDGDSAPAGTPALARGIAFGGDCGVARVDLSIDGGKLRCFIHHTAEVLFRALCEFGRNGSIKSF
jgi:hypothetical protein